MPGKIFINYRREDAPDSTGRLYDRLEREFDSNDLFMDVEGHIKPGDDFVEVLNRQVEACDVLLAVIGPRWTDLLAAHAGYDDFVAIEIKAALDLGKPVIPVLVGGAGMPHADTMPEPIRALARRHAVHLRPERFKADYQVTVKAIRDKLAESEMERLADKAEAEWPAVRDSGDPVQLRRFEQRFAGTPAEHWAREVRNYIEGRQAPRAAQRPVTQGTLARLTDRGYGFIKPDGGEKDLFFHGKDLQDVRFDDLREGEKVILEVEEGPKGPYAVSVRRG